MSLKITQSTYAAARKVGKPREDRFAFKKQISSGKKDIIEFSENAKQILAANSNYLNKQHAKINGIEDISDISEIIYIENKNPENITEISDAENKNSENISELFDAENKNPKNISETLDAENKNPGEISEIPDTENKDPETDNEKKAEEKTPNSENGGSVAVNVGKRMRMIAAAKTADNVRVVLQLLEGDLKECKDGLEKGWCDENEIAKVEALIELANKRMSEVAGNDTEDPAEQSAFELSMLF